VWCSLLPACFSPPSPRRRGRPSRVRSLLLGRAALTPECQLDFFLGHGRQSLSHARTPNGAAISPLFLSFRCFGIGNCNLFLRAERTSRERERRLESSRAHTPARHVLTTRHPRGESLVSSVHPGSPPATLRARPRGLLFRATTSPPVSREWRPGSRHRQASREQRVLPTALRVLPRVPAGYVAFRPCFFPDCQRLSNR